MKPECFSCRVYGVLKRGRQVLMTRSIFIRREFVNFPGGGVELGESPMQALHREYEEETGLVVRPVRVLYASQGLHLSTQRPMQIVSIYWLVEEAGGSLRGGGNNDDVLQLFWADIENIPTDEMFPSDLEFARLLPRILKTSSGAGSALAGIFAAAIAWCIFSAAVACSAMRPQREPVLLDVAALDPSIVLDIRYATADNFTGRALYPAARCLLKPQAARRLALVQRDLRARGLGLKVFDCYRPHSVQQRLWELVPDERYVANPAKGSRHNRGLAVDVTLLDSAGHELEMPTSYDDFTEKAHRGHPASAQAAKNSDTLERAMERRGFVGLATEWWHFDAPGRDHAPILDVPLDHR